VSDRRGHINVSRKFFQDDPWWNEPRTYSRAEAWLDFLHLAAYRSRVHMTTDGPIPLDRGQLVASYRYLAGRWGWSVKQVRTWIDTCQKWARIRAQRETHAGTVYAIANYDYYQGGGTAQGTPEGTGEGTEGAQQGHSKGTRKKQVSKKAGEDAVLPPGYLEAACKVWQTRGHPNVGLIGKVHKPLVRAHGPRQVLLAWEGYINDRRDKDFAHPVDFATNYELYRRKWAVEIGEDGTEIPIPDEPEAAA
jgi:hypothetical protein